MARREESPPESVPTDPEGPDPPNVPDPMPADLRRSETEDQTDDDDNPMDGDAPTG
jgi:hypothetical protein